jgi:hypothetical protein
MSYTVRITERDLDRWRASWPCSTLTTGTVYFESNGDLVDLTGRIARADVDAHELTAFCNDRLPADIRR